MYYYKYVCSSCNKIMEVGTPKKQDCYRSSCNGSVKSTTNVWTKFVEHYPNSREWCIRPTAADDNFPLVIKEEEEMEKKKKKKTKNNKK